MNFGIYWEESKIFKAIDLLYVNDHKSNLRIPDTWYSPSTKNWKAQVVSSQV